MNYEVELAQPNQKSYKIITIFMAFLNAVSFIFYFLNATSVFLKIISIAGLFASVLLLYIVFVKMASWKSAFKVVAFLLGFIAICWLLAGNYYFTLLFSLLSIFSFITLRPSVIIFNKEGIKYPSFPEKFYEWKEVNQVIIKDDVLSMDLADNKFLQFLLPATSVAKIEVSAFNIFCEKEIATISHSKN